MQTLSINNVILHKEYPKHLLYSVTYVCITQAFSPHYFMSCLKFYKIIKLKSMCICKSGIILSSTFPTVFYNCNIHY